MVTFQSELKITVRRDQGMTGGIDGMQQRFSRGAASLPYNFARRVQRYARAKAPVRTGYLKSSIKRYRLQARLHRVIVEAHYGIYVNYGTRYMRAQPFWEPAIAQARRDLRREAREMLHGTR